MAILRIAAELGREGLVVNRKAVQHHMREMGIAGICPGPNLSRRRHEHKVYPYLLLGLSITAPDQIWGFDLTYIRMRRTWMYLVALLDWCTRHVVAWELGDPVEEELVIEPVRRALAQNTLHYPHLCGGGRKTMGIGIGERSKGGLDRTVGIE